MEFSNQYDRLYYESLRIRMVEERIIELYPSDRIQSPVHLSIGQEAVAVGTCNSLKPQDLVFCTYRSHAYYLAKGGSLRQMFAELYGKSTGCCGGKGGSMHLAAPEVGLMGTSAVVASTISHAVGAAMAAKLLKKEQIAVAVFGDGAMDEGVYHESLNFAAIRKVPILFLVENNSLAVHSRADSRHSFSTLEHARTYGIPAETVEEGWDFMKISDRVAREVAILRREKSPRLIEVRTFRYKEHVGVGEDYDAGYRSRGELLVWQKNDPLIEDTRSREAFRSAIALEIKEAVKFAEESSLPQPSELLRNVI